MQAILAAHWEAVCAAEAADDARLLQRGISGPLSFEGGAARCVSAIAVNNNFDLTWLPAYCPQLVGEAFLTVLKEQRQCFATVSCWACGRTGNGPAGRSGK